MLWLGYSILRLQDGVAEVIFVEVVVGCGVARLIESIIALCSHNPPIEVEVLN